MWREDHVAWARVKTALSFAVLVFAGAVLCTVAAASPAFGAEASEGAVKSAVPAVEERASASQSSASASSPDEGLAPQTSTSASDEGLASQTSASASQASSDEGSASKKAIPAIEKTVSAGGAWAKDIQAEPASTLYYRIEATMPEDVENWESLVYRIVDEPAEGVTVDWSSVSAHVESPKGKNKGAVAAAVTPAGQSTVLTFGDLKKSDFELAFGDILVVEYPARLDSSAAGSYRNVARLDYLLGGDWLSSVEVDSSVQVPDQVLEQPPAQGSGSGFDKTGYVFMRYWPAVAGIGVALVVAGVALVAIGKKRSSRQGVPFNPDAPWMY